MEGIPVDRKGLLKVYQMRQGALVVPQLQKASRIHGHSRGQAVLHTADPPPKDNSPQLTVHVHQLNRASLDRISPAIFIHSKTYSDMSKQRQFQSRWKMTS